ncbi:LysR family transcriptional regulator [Allostella vacuolata]|nr:LysR family transcriptional regulator [Stella vacuolata]
MTDDPRSGGLELRHLRYFLALAEEMNYGRAAQRLGIAQPGLSQQIKRLEEIVGATLVDRTQRAVRLTTAGELLVAGATRTLAQAEQSLVAARRAGRGELGRLSIGYVASAAYVGVLTSMIYGFRQTHPDAELHIAEMEMRPQLAAIEDGRLDICFIRPPVDIPLGITTLSILHEPVLLAIPADHPLAPLPEIPLDRLGSEVFILPHHPPGVSFHHHTFVACRQAGFFPRTGPEGRDFMTIASMVAVGLGVALVPQSLRCIELPGVLYKPIAGMAVTAELAIAFRRTEPSAVARAFVQFARRFVA